MIEKRFFESWNLSYNALSDIIFELSQPQQMCCDIFLEYQNSHHWQVEDSAFKDGRAHCGFGAGLRTVVGEQIGFSSTSDLRVESLLRNAHKASSFMRSGSKMPLAKTALYTNPSKILAPYQQHNVLMDDYDSMKTWMLDLDRKVRQQSSDIHQVSIDLSQSMTECLICREDGVLAWDIRPMIRLNITGFLNAHNHTYTGSLGFGGRYGWADLIAQTNIDEVAAEIYRLACFERDAQEAPSGNMPVILGAGWPAVLIHEAVGHGIEADFNRKKTSIYHDQRGKFVASPLCTIIDDGTLPSLRGSLAVDDEGEASSKTVLIENGILKNYLFDRQNAALMNEKTTGNGRRESAFYPPMPRMTNTYLAPGKHTLEEMIDSVEDGIYAVNFGGGSVDITSGQFVFSAQEAYRVIKGKVAYPVKGATLIGIGPEILKKISMVGNDFKHDRGVGTCGKNGQSVPVTVGQPSLKIDQLVVGGEHE